MSFVFQEVVISGTQEGVEGTSAAIQSLSSAMQSMGWSVYDDRTDQPGASHKLILYNNQGEDATASGIYMVLTSGSDQVNVQMSTEWDDSAHDFGSGVAIPNTNLTPTAGISCIFTDADGDYVLWIAGDKDAIVVYSKNSGGGRASDYSGAAFGRAIPFLDVELEPYGVYASSTTGTSPFLAPSTSRVYGLVGNPPVTTGANQTEFNCHFVTMTDQNSEPRRGLDGSDDWVYTPIPVIFAANRSGVTEGVIGIVKHLWTTCEAEAGGLHNEGVLYDPISGREYLIFVSGISHNQVMRKS